MKLFILKILLQRRAKDEGFTLPMVIALGLIMLLLGTVQIVKSNEENITAINTNSSSDALALAEVGVARYRELLNQNRILTIYNNDQWDQNSVPVDFLGDGVTRNINVRSQVCNKINPNSARTPPSWFDDSDPNTHVNPNSTTQWWEVKQNVGDDSIGEYRLVSYVYDNDGNPADNDNGQFVPDDDNTNITDAFEYNDIDIDDVPNDGYYNPKGILTVQGRSSTGSVAQIKVEIPLRINDLDNLAPVLWVRSGAIANPGTLNVSNGNIVLRRGPTNNGQRCLSSATAIAGNANIIKDPRFMPAALSLPAGERNNLPGAKRNTTNGEVILPIPKNPPEKKDGNGRFLYQTGGVLTIENNNLVTDGSAKVILRVNADINITALAGAGILLGTEPLTVGNENAVNLANFNNGDTTNTNVSSQNFELHVGGDRNITINPNGGIINIEAFIHAPNSTLEIPVGATGTVNINGAVWINEYVDNSSGAVTVNIKNDKTDTTTGIKPAYKFYSSSELITPRPVTGSPTEWKREEVE